jgi:ABC-type multidrug transport system ATPase subunit
MALTSITLENVSKKFSSNPIFSKINYRFTTPNRYAITGPNGSGKSTLLKILAGIITPNSGKVSYKIDGSDKSVESVSTFVSLCAPYLELPEELTLSELFDFHSAQRKLNITKTALADELQLDTNKEIRLYSSGMKQRLKLALALYANSSIIFLDEPTSNLDDTWANWYQQKMQTLSEQCLVVISSNEKREYDFCNEVFKIDTYKP